MGAEVFLQLPGFSDTFSAGKARLKTPNSTSGSPADQSSRPNTSGHSIEEPVPFFLPVFWFLSGPTWPRS